jgi:hypothetical protein
MARKVALLSRPRRFPPCRVTPIQLRKKAIVWEGRGLPKIGARDLRISTAQVVKNYIASHRARSLAEAVARHRIFQMRLTPTEHARARRDLEGLGSLPTEREIIEYGREIKLGELRLEHGATHANRVIARRALVHASQTQASTLRLRASPIRRSAPRARRAPRIARVAAATSPPAPDGPPTPPAPPRRAPRAAGGDS